MSVESCENKILTVTVPAYNAEGFLRDCLDSLCLAEILPDLEVLVINDGSTDSTAQIAEEYEKRFPDTVRLISKENGGHGSGINCGVANATGKYFKVVDADDWVERDGFLKLVGTLKDLAPQQEDQDRSQEEGKNGCRLEDQKTDPAKEKRPGVPDHVEMAVKLGAEPASKSVAGSDLKKIPGNAENGRVGRGKEKIPDIVFSNFYWVYEKADIPKEEYERGTELAEPFPGVQYEKIYCFDNIADRLYIKMHNMTIRTEILKNMAEAGETDKTGGRNDRLKENSETVTDIKNSGPGGSDSAGLCRDSDVNNWVKPLRMDEHCFYVDTEYVTYPIPFVETIYFIREYVYDYRIGRQGQSVGMERMRRNERDYDRVLESLLSFYDRLERDIPCSPEKKRYISNMIARVAAAKIKIMLSFPASSEKKRELAVFDRKLKEQYPEIYQSNINGAVKALRTSGYLLYRPAAWMVKKKYSD